MNTTYKLLFVLACMLTATTSFAQVGIGTTAPAGMLDVRNSDNYGIVFPKAALTATNVQAPVLNPNGGNIVRGTTVFNTNTTSTGSNDVYPGIYVWDTDTNTWIPQYLREDSAIFDQTTLDLRVTNSGSYVDVPGLGSGSSFTAKYTGEYRVKAQFNFGAGKPILPTGGQTIKMPTQEGYFRFTFDGAQSLIYTHAYSLYNDGIGGGTYYEEFRHDSSLVLYVNLTAGQTYNFRLEIDMFVSSEYENGGNSGDGRAHVGIGLPCTVEITYLEE